MLGRKDTPAAEGTAGEGDRQSKHPQSTRGYPQRQESTLPSVEAERERELVQLRADRAYFQLIVNQLDVLGVSLRHGFIQPHEVDRARAEILGHAGGDGEDGGGDEC